MKITFVKSKVFFTISVGRTMTLGMLELSFQLQTFLRLYLLQLGTFLKKKQLSNHSQKVKTRLRMSILNILIH